MDDKFVHQINNWSAFKSQTFSNGLNVMGIFAVFPEHNVIVCGYFVEKHLFFGVLKMKVDNNSELPGHGWARLAV